MDDEAELQAKIAALAGQINKHKQHPPAHHHAPRPPPHFNQGASRWSPYGGRGAFPPHKNRTLILGNKQPGSPPNSHPEPPQTALVPPPSAFVTARRAGVNQMMTKEAFERQQKMKADNQVKQLAVKQTRHGSNQTATASKEPAREMEIEGIRYQLLNDGSKLIRLPGENDLPVWRSQTLNIADPSADKKETPKKATIAGVEFLRTKHGNLVRANTTKITQRYSSSIAQIALDPDSHLDQYRNNKPKPQCENFTKHGTRDPHLGALAMLEQPRFRVSILPSEPALPPLLILTLT